MTDQNRPKSRKVLDIACEGVWHECVRYYGKKNPYRLYVCTWDGGKKRRQVAAYANFVSVIEHIRNYAHKAHWGFQDCF